MKRQFAGPILAGFALCLVALSGCDPERASRQITTDSGSHPDRVLSAPPLSATPLEYTPIPSLMTPKLKRKAFRPDFPDPVPLNYTDISRMKILSVKDLLNSAQNLNHTVVRLRARVVEGQDKYWLLYDGSIIQYVSDRRPPAVPGYNENQSDGPALVKVSPRISNINLNDNAEVVGIYDAVSNTINASNAKIIFTGLEQ